MRIKIGETVSIAHDLPSVPSQVATYRRVEIVYNVIRDQSPPIKSPPSEDSSDLDISMSS
jgi:hypothetical protein